MHGLTGEPPGWFNQKSPARAALWEGLRIPQDVALAGFSNFNQAGLFDPTLTTIEQPVFETGRTPAELLIAQIESKRPVSSFSKIVLPATLHVRASSCVAAVAG